ncbi:MAG: glucose 1-dehydrogenase [Dehalococcoidales bacterium]|nr:glucose 1-dehydrogenase [Dehalococcoidales bacterium]
MDRVKGKVAIVTGGASGLGEAAAKLMAKEGASVAITDIDDVNGNRVVSEITSAGGSARFWHMDVTDENAIEKTFSDIYQKYNSLHILVNSAGIPGPPKLTHEITSAEWDKVLDINTKGTFLCVKYAVPFMLKSGGGSVINISSMLGLMGGDDPVYHASKGAVRLMTKSDAFNYAGSNIRFNSVHPGYILTPLFRGFGVKHPEGPEKFFAEMAAKIPQGRLGTAEDVASGILYLASDESSYVTGIELSIDGGYMVRG